jgi:sugar lactone lactonase YvrE
VKEKGFFFLPWTIGGMLLICLLATGCMPDRPNIPDASKCELIEEQTNGIVGPEDLVYDDSYPGGRLIISSQQRLRGKKSHSGNLYWMDLTTKKFVPFVIEPIEFDPEPIYPHGIDLVRQTDGRLILYVVNQGNGEQCHSEEDQIKNSIKAYVVDGPKLWYQQDMSLSDDRLTQPNDVTATASGDLYVTNMTRRCSSKKMGFLLEMIPGLRTGSVVHYRRQTKTWSPVLSDLSLPNGIALNRDDSQLWVAESGNNTVSVFRRNSTANLEHIKSFSIPTPDNFSVDGEGVLVASHQCKWEFLKHSESPTALSSWAVYALNSNMAYPTPLLKNDGSLISGVSVAVRANRSLLIGQIFGSHLLACPDN